MEQKVLTIEKQKFFDLTAVRILISVVAISLAYLLSHSSLYFEHDNEVANSSWSLEKSENRKN